MPKQIKSILILGGGTAGWLTANHLGYLLRKSDSSDIRVTVVESSDIPTIGVGEGTVPAIRHSLKKFGIKERDLLSHCQATFKQGIKFEDWLRDPKDIGPHYYYHPFDYPDVKSIDLTGYWLRTEGKKRSFADYVSLQSRMCDRNLSPKVFGQGEYEGAASYAYHLDATKFTELLAKNAVERFSVKRLDHRVVDVRLAQDGTIHSLKTDSGDELSADFYVDCSGFSSRLLGQSLAVPIVEKKKVLFADSALAVQVPYTGLEESLPSVTIAKARPAGWMWDIALQNRRGTGYVYSSEFCSDDAAESDFRLLLDDPKGELALRKISMTVGYRKKFWVGNCAAIGLAQGFVEPLEATGLLMFDASAALLAELLPGDSADLNSAAQQFNSVMANAWDRVIDFIKLHYCLSARNDTDFWRMNRDPESIPESLAELLARWKRRVPCHVDFPNSYDVFSLENYLYVLYGMEYPTDLTGQGSRYLESQRVVDRLIQRDAQLDMLLGKLPKHREFLCEMMAFDNVNRMFRT
ncbi:tryptophan 7-halogenase [Simiduia litorea]|uniref:tryptophan halogenase family protein n=1 Tax=Simiduia litorea TaxID=1435348 RepID=UPI0036F394B6